MEPNRFRYDTRGFPGAGYRQPGIGALSVLLLGLMLLAAGSVWAKENTAPLEKAGWFVNMHRFSQGAHTGISCAQCHGTMTEKGQSHPDFDDMKKLQRDTRKMFDYGRCKSCHSAAHSRAGQGAHAEALAKENKEGVAVDSKTGEPRPAPQCGDCHASHYDRSHLSRNDLGRLMVGRCGSCHPQQLQTYLENYHGKAAVYLDHERAALCSDCHGAHATRSLKTDEKQLLSTCRSCHPEAGPAYASIVIHYKAGGSEEKSSSKAVAISRVHVISLVSLVFIVVLLVGFYSHSFMLQLRKLHDHLRKKA